MPRSGKFGRRRGGSTNLTALIAQLLREQRAAEDRTMFDAWENGGLVDGKPVTDERLLEYITGRRDGYSSDDPLYDEWNNRLIQYGFSIGEQKIQLAFREGKASASAVAAFYRSQLKNIPKDSAFYRDVAGRAAQWAESARSAARGAARGSATKGLRKQLNDLIYKGAEYEALERALTEFARREGIISGTQELTEASATDLRALFDRGIYIGDDRLTFDDFRTAAVDQYKNLSKQVDIQVQLGNQGITARNKRDKFLDETLVGLNTVDERFQYEAVRQAWLDETESAQGNPYAIAAANQKYAAALGRVYTNASQQIDGYSQNSSEFIGALSNEIDALATGTAKGTSVAEIFGVNNDLADTAESVVGVRAAIKDIESGRAYYGQTVPGGPLGVNAFPPQTLGSPFGIDPSLQPSVTSVNGIQQLVYLKGQSVTATTIVDSATGEPPPADIDPATLRSGILSGAYELIEGQSLGYVFVNPMTRATKYGVIDPVSGTMRFTDTNPWASDPFNNGGSLQVLTGATVGPDLKYIPDLAGAFPEGVAPDLTAFDPILADGTVAPRDLLRLIDAGIPGVSYTPEDVESYRAKLQRQIEVQDNAIVSRYRGASYNELGRLGQVPYNQDTYEVGGGGDLRSAILLGMNAVRDVAQTTFASPTRTKDDTYTPPPPPRAPSLTKDDAYTPKPAPTLSQKLATSDPSGSLSGISGIGRVYDPPTITTKPKAPPVYQNKASPA